MNEEIKAVEYGYDLIKSFLEKLAGPAAEEIGLMLQDQVKYYRYKNQVKILNKAKLYLDKNNIDPKPIPLRTLLPLLEGASLEDNDYLADKWAVLIANSSSGLLNKGNHPSYPKILMELSPIDAVLFDEIYSINDSIIWTNFKPEFAKKHALIVEDVSFSYENLFRLSLIHNTAKGLYKTFYGKEFFHVCQKR